MLVANAAMHLGMDVYGYDPYVSIDSAWRLSRNIIHAKTVDELYKECDFITIHVPALESTIGMIDRDAISLMKKGVVVLNFARDLLVDEEAMVDALVAGQVKHYAVSYTHLDEAGGVYAVMAELNKKGLLHTDCLTVTGKTVGENIKDAVNKDPQVIRPIDNPYSQTGGLAVLKGNLAPDGSVVKRSAVVEEMLVHVGPARVFDCEEAAIEAIKGGKIVAGDVVVIRYVGPVSYTHLEHAGIYRNL